MARSPVPTGRVARGARNGPSSPTARANAAAWLDRRPRREPHEANGPDGRRRRHGNARIWHGRHASRATEPKNVAGRVIAIFERTIVSCTAGLPRRPPPFDPSCGSRLCQTVVRGRARRATWSRPCRHVSGFGFVCLDGLPASVQPTVAATIPSFLPRAPLRASGRPRLPVPSTPPAGTRRRRRVAPPSPSRTSEGRQTRRSSRALRRRPLRPPCGSARLDSRALTDAANASGSGASARAPSPVGFIGRLHRDDDRRAGGPPGGYGAAGVAKDVLPG